MDINEAEKNAKQPLLIITGPTSVGKTEISVKVAKHIHAEIISADSMQVYRHMDIGTAKIQPSEMDNIPHHLIDIIEPNESYNVASFYEMAQNALSAIYSKNALPIIAGGTGFYIQSILYGIDFSEGDEDPEYRDKLFSEFKSGNGTAVYNELRTVDPLSASKIHPNDTRRIIRALEFYKVTGKKISNHNEEQAQNSSPYNFIYFVLTDDRDRIYSNIDKRVDLMMQRGLLNEVKSLYFNQAFENSTALQAIGYKEIIAHLNGEMTLDEAVNKIKQNTRHYAKRQLTWFKREKDVTWLNKKDFDYDNDKIAEHILNEIKNKNII